MSADELTAILDAHGPEGAVTKRGKSGDKRRRSK